MSIHQVSLVHFSRPSIVKIKGIHNVLGKYNLNYKSCISQLLQIDSTNISKIDHPNLTIYCILSTITFSHHSSSGLSFIGTSMILGLSMTLALLVPFCTTPTIHDCNPSSCSIFLAYAAPSSRGNTISSPPAIFVLTVTFVRIQKPQKIKHFTLSKQIDWRSFLHHCQAHVRSIHHIDILYFYFFFEC